MTKLSVLACQITIPQAITRGTRDAHVRAICSKIGQQLTAKPHELVVLPELSTVEYSRAAFDHLDEIAEDLDGFSMQAFSELAHKHKTTIVFGMPRKADEHFCISQVAVGPDGSVLCAYDKLHICQYGASMEKEYFAKGDRLSTFAIKGIKIAPIICYDIRIPELSRTLAVEHDVDLILHCGAYARDESFYSWHHFVVTRALENQLFFMSLNRAGENFGSSLFCPPWIDETISPYAFPQTEEHFASLTVDLAASRKAREDYTFLLDRFDDYTKLKA